VAYERKYKRGDKMRSDEGFEPKETVAEVTTFKSADIPDRGIRKETLERFGVKVAVSQEDGKTPTAVYFPSYNQKGKVVGYTKQDLTKGKEEKGHWSAIGSVTIGNKMFGQNVAEAQNRKRNNLVVTEGQWDCLSVFQSLVDNVKGTKYEGIEPLVVSIPMGTANAVESILHNESYVLSHDALTIFFDDDHCTPAELAKKIMKGHEAREAVANALVGSGLSLFTVTPEEGFKDASDFMQAGRSSDLAKLVQFGRRPYSSEKIVKAGDLDLEFLLEPRPEGIYVNSFPRLMDKLHGFRTRELVLLTSPSGVGKSTVCSIFASAFMGAGEKLGMIYLEETNKETMQRLIAAKLKVNYLEFKNNPLQVTTKEKIQAAYNEIVDNDQLVMLGHFGSLPVSELMAKIKHMHLVEGCNFIILDHLSLVISGSAVKDERKELDMVMTELAAFCAANDVCIIAVSHINRSAAEQFKAPKLKEGEEPKPYWVQVSKEMMRGSAALEQLSFVILGLEPEINPDRSRGRVRLTVLKNRPWSYLGVADTFKIDDESWEVLLCEDNFNDVDF
jgi:archaellum biogenesis ATPase FlaH